MNQFQVFLRMEKKPLIAWSLGTGLYVGLMGLMFVALGGGEGLTELAETYPEEILEALGADELSSVEGFLGAEFGAIAPIVFGIFLVMFMTKHLAGSEESGSIDHMLARPVSRTNYYWHLVAAASTGYGAIMFVSTIFAILGFAGVATSREMLGIIGVMVDLIPYGLVFIGLGGLLGATFHQRGRANAIGAAVVAASFLLDLASRLADGMEWLQYVTPTGYLARSDLAGGQPDPLYIVVSLIAATILAAAGWWVHEKKQLYA